MSQEHRSRSPLTVAVLQAFGLPPFLRSGATPPCAFIGVVRRGVADTREDWDGRMSMSQIRAARVHRRAMRTDRSAASRR